MLWGPTDWPRDQACLCITELKPDDAEGTQAWTHDGCGLLISENLIPPVNCLLLSQARRAPNPMARTQGHGSPCSRATGPD